MSNSWSAPTDLDTVRRRAGGRRRYNAWRQFMRSYRRSQVAKLLLELIDARQGSGPLGIHGRQAIIARKLGVSRATISRDVRALMGEFRPCPHCGKPVPPYSWALVDLSGIPIAPEESASLPTGDAAPAEALALFTAGDADLDEPRRQTAQL